jgi:hypothetical protein
MRSMSEQRDPQAADAVVGSHGQPTDHGDDGGHADHGHTEEALGPVDTAAWGAGIAGILLGLVVAAALAVSAGVIRL